MILLYDFNVDKANNTIHVTREFAADLDLVWDAWTKAEILDQWFAPKPFRARTKEMDFREGGRWLYAMTSDGNVLGWSLADFIKIEPKSSFTSKNSFSDENGNPITTGFVSSITTTSFTAEGDRTTVRIEKKMGSLSDLERFLAMGFKEGNAAGMVALDEYFQELMTKK